MTKNTKKDNLRKQIYESMLPKETDELLEILRKGDRKEWTETAIDVAKEILLDRLGEIPLEGEQQDESQIVSNDKDIYHSEKNLLKISSWANTLAWVVLGIYILIFIGRIVVEIQNINQGVTTTIYQAWTWFSMLSTPVIGLVYFLILQAISEGIYMLMDIEKNGLQLLKVKKR
jgi:lipid-A-disaccharide synthase-like uncharacterized protein